MASIGQFKKLRFLDSCSAFIGESRYYCKSSLIAISYEEGSYSALCIDMPFCERTDYWDSW